MKHILTLIIAICLCFNVKAQTDAAKIIGIWELTKFIYGNNPNNNEQHSSYKKFKLFTPTHFTVIEIDPNTNITNTSILGTYSLNNGIYIEKILNVNRESSGMIGLSFSFTLAFEGNDKMFQIGGFNGMKTSEMWTRVGIGNDPEQIFQGESTSVVRVPDQRMLYIINTPDKQIEVIPNPEYPDPLSSIPQKGIASIEVLKDKTATERFGEKGKYGVVIITTKEGYLDDFLTKLKKQKNIL